MPTSSAFPYREASRPRRWQGDGLRRRRRGRPDRVPPRQPDVVVPVAQRHPPPRRPRAAASPPTSSAWATRTSWTSPVRTRYTFVEHRHYLDGLLERARRDRTGRARGARLGLGARLRLDESAPRRRRRDRLHGGHRPAGHLGRPGPRPPEGSSRRSALRPATTMVLEKNVFVERVLPASVLRTLTDGGDGRVPATVPRARREPAAHADVAPTDPHRRRAGRRHRHRGRLRRVAGARARCRSCSSTLIRARSSTVRNSSSVARGRTRPKSPSPATTSCRRTAPTRSARPSPSGSHRRSGDDGRVTLTPASSSPLTPTTTRRRRVELVRRLPHHVVVGMTTVTEAEPWCHRATRTRPAVGGGMSGDVDTRDAVRSRSLPVGRPEPTMARLDDVRGAPASDDVRS